MAKKVYEDSYIAAIAAKIREKAGTTTTYNTQQMPSGIEEVYNKGHSVGHSAGKTEGYADGFAAGRAEGYAAGYAEGYAAGLSDGTPDEPAYTNLFVKSEAHDDYRLNSSGILTAATGDLVTGFISVKPSTSYTIRTRNLTDSSHGVIGRLSEYSAANESNHVTQYRPSESADKFWENVTDFCFPFTTSASTKFIRLNMISGKGCDFIITLNEPIPIE